MSPLSFVTLEPSEDTAIRRLSAWKIRFTLSGNFYFAFAKNILR